MLSVITQRQGGQPEYLLMMAVGLLGGIGLGATAVGLPGRGVPYRTNIYKNF